MTHPGGDYKITQIVATTSHVNFDLAPEIPEKHSRDSARFAGDLALSTNRLEHVSFKEFRHNVLRYTQHLSMSKNQIDVKKVIIACLNIIERQLIPGGNPALASDFLRLLHLLLSIEKITNGQLHAGIYTDHDAHATMAAMSTLSKNELLKTLNPNTTSPKQLMLYALKSPLPPRPVGEDKPDTKSLPFEYYTCQIDSSHNTLPPRIKDPHIRKFYNNYDIGNMHISGGSGDKIQLLKARDAILSHLRLAVCRYKACFSALDMNSTFEDLGEHRLKKLNASLDEASLNANSTLASKNNEALREPFADQLQGISLGDLGRSLHRSLPMSLNPSDAYSTLGDLLVVMPLAKIIIAEAHKTNPKETTVEDRIYPLEQSDKMTRLRYDYFDAFYEYSWRNRGEPQLPITTSFAQKTSRFRTIDIPPSMNNKLIKSSVRPSSQSRLSSDTSDIPVYILDQHNRGL